MQYRHNKSANKQNEQIAWNLIKNKMNDLFVRLSSTCQQSSVYTNNICRFFSSLLHFMFACI